MHRSGKRKRSTITACTSPRPAFLTRHSTFNWFDEDIWTEIAKYLDGKCLVKLGMANKWFHRLIMEESVWKYASLRDLQVPAPRGQISCNWRQIYSSAFGNAMAYKTNPMSIPFFFLFPGTFAESHSLLLSRRYSLSTADGSHSYTFRQREKHIDWLRIGAFFFDSQTAILTEHLSLPKNRNDAAENPDKSIQTSGCCMLTNIKPGIWIAGTMQILDARHAELFLQKEFRDGTWDYEGIGVHRVDKHSTAAAGAIFDVKHLDSACTAGVLDLKSWVGSANDWQPKARIGLYAVAVNTNLQPNEGLNVKFHVMKAGADGKVVSIRISQQLL